MSSLAVITGASSGIGLEFTKQLAAKGHDLFLVARDEAGLKRVASEVSSEHNVVVDYLACDLTNSDAIDKILKQLGNKRVNILINNAGIGDYSSFIEADPKKLDSMMRLNILALVNLTRELLPKMINQKPARILNVASTAAFFPGPKMAVYYASKAFVLSFSEALSFELKDSGVTVTALCPGPTATKFAETARASKSSLFKNPASLASAQEVVAYGIESMESGKLIALPGGWMQKIMIQLPRFIPRKSVAGLVARAQNRN